MTTTKLFTKDILQALFTLAGIEILNVWELPNGYWPRVSEYQELRDSSPWWLVKTHVGLIEIGWRKRVLNIDWSDTTVRASITSDAVTKTKSMVHAWNDEKALQYLKALSSRIKDTLSKRDD